MEAEALSGRMHLKGRKERHGKIRQGMVNKSAEEVEASNGPYRH